MAIITNLQPPAGEPIASDTVLSFDVIDPVIAELRVFVWVVFRETGQVELANDGDNFQPLYSFSQITTIPGGRRYSIRRVGGWPSTPELRVDDCACPPEIGGGGGSGEANTASNQGGGAGALFITKVAEDLQFRTLKSSDGSIGILTDVDNTVDLTFAGSALTEPVLDPSNTPVANPGPPPTQDLVLVDGAAGVYFDPNLLPQDDLVVLFPAITAANFGRRVGVALPAGNPFTAIQWTPALADAFIDPTYNLNGPGAPTVDSAATYSPTLLVWQAVEDLAGPGVHGWAFEYASNLGGGGGDWASVLAAGNASGGTDAIMSGEDEIEWNPPPTGGPGPVGPPILRGWRTARRLAPISNGGTPVNIGGPLVDALDLQQNGDFVLLRLQGFRRVQTGPSLVSWADLVIERVYSVGAGGVLTVVNTITYRNPGDWLSVVWGPGIQLSCLGGDENSVEAYVMAEVIVGRAQPPS